MHVTIRARENIMERRKKVSEEAIAEESAGFSDRLVIRNVGVKRRLDRQRHEEAALRGIGISTRESLLGHWAE